MDSAPFVDAPPGSADIFLILLSAASHELWAYYAFMTSVGEILGGYLTYRIAEKGGQQTLEKKVGKARAEKVYKGFAKHGFLAIFSGAIAPPPFPFTSVLLAAGIMQYPRKKFFAALASGRSLRFFIEAFLARTYGRRMIAFFSSHYKEVMYLLIAMALIAGIGALIYFKHAGSRKKREKPA